MTDHNTPWVDADTEREREDRERENELWDDNVRQWEQDERERVEGHVDHDAFWRSVGGGDV